MGRVGVQTDVVFDGVKRVFVGRPLHTRPDGGHAAAQKGGVGGVLFGPDLVGGLCDRADLLVLAAGGLAALAAAPWVALAVILLLVTVVASYRQTCYAYPTGGGAYVVSRENLGEAASLAAAAALLVDYVMTVAVSVTSGVVAVTSAFPSLSPHAVILAVGLIVRADGGQPARHPGVRAGVRGAHLRLRRADPADVRLGRRSRR